MINLLPPKEKEELLRLKKQKMIAVLGSVILLFLLCFALMLLAIRIYISGQLALQTTLAQEAEKSSVSLTIESQQKQLKLAEQTFSQLNTFYENKFDFTEAIDKISQLLPRAVYLYNLSFNSEGQNKARVSLSGFAPSRAALLELQENLEKVPIFEAVNFPASIWVRDKDINFSVSFNYLRTKVE